MTRNVIQAQILGIPPLKVSRLIAGRDDLLLLASNKKNLLVIENRPPFEWQQLEKASLPVRFAQFDGEGTTFLVLAGGGKHDRQICWWQKNEETWELERSIQLSREVRAFRSRHTAITAQLNKLYYTEHSELVCFDLMTQSMTRHSLWPLRALGGPCVSQEGFIWLFARKSGEGSKLAYVDPETGAIQRQFSVLGSREYPPVLDPLNDRYFYMFGRGAIYIVDLQIPGNRHWQHFSGKPYEQFIVLAGKRWVRIFVGRKRTEMWVKLYNWNTQIGECHLSGHWQASTIAGGFLYFSDIEGQLGRLDLGLIPLLSERLQIQRDYPVGPIICECCDEWIPCPSCGVNDLLRGWVAGNETLALCYNCGVVFRTSNNQVLEDLGLQIPDRRAWGARALALLGQVLSGED